MKSTEILSEILEEINADNKIKITIAGAGVAGIFSALEIMREYPNAQIKIIEKKQKILSGTSANTPGRMGLGYHYKDFETAVNYMKNTIIFMKKYRDCFIEDEGKPNLVNGRYFVLKDSIIDPQDLISTYDKLSLEFEKLWMADPEIQKLFPHTCHLHRTIPPSEYSQYVDPKIVHLAIETREKLLDWDKFEKKVLSELDEFIRSGNVEILTSAEVVGVSYNEDSSFQIELEEKTTDGKIRNFQKADFFINSTWHNIESLNKKFNITNLEPWISRMKLLAEVKIPESLSNAHSMFFCLGPFAMFSNMGLKKDKGYSYGRLTFAKITNHSHYPSTEMPDFYHRFLDGELNDKDLEYLDEKGRQIIKGVAEYIPQMADAELIKVFSGIIKSVGDVDIFNPNSKFHERREFGTSEELLGFYVNASIKLFYCVHNAKKISEMLKKSIVSIIIIDHLLKKIYKNTFFNELEKKNIIVFLRAYIKRYLFDQFNSVSINLVDKIFKQESLLSADRSFLFSSEQRKILDNFFNELFLDMSGALRESQSSDVKNIFEEKKRLKIFYDSLLESLIQKNKVLKQIRVIGPSFSQQRYDSVARVKEKSLRELYVESEHYSSQAILKQKLIKDSQKTGLFFPEQSQIGVGSQNYLFDFGLDIKHSQRFKVLFASLVSDASELIQGFKADLFYDAHEKQEAIYKDILKFYEEFLLKKLPEIFFDFKKNGKIVMDQPHYPPANVSVDKQSCIEVLELILNIEDNDVKIFFLNSFKLFLEEFIKTYNDEARRFNSLDEIKEYLEFEKKCYTTLLKSISETALDDEISIVKFATLFVIGIVSYTSTLSQSYSDQLVDQDENKKREFFNFKIAKYLEIFNNHIDEKHFIALSQLSFENYLKISSLFEDQIPTDDNSEKTLNLEISCKLFEIAFEKKTKSEIINFFEELNSFLCQKLINQPSEFFGFQDDDNQIDWSNILKSLYGNQELRALIESYPDIDAKVLVETISACFNNITLALEFRNVVSGSLDQICEKNDFLLESHLDAKLYEIGGLSSSPSNRSSATTNCDRRSISPDRRSDRAEVSYDSASEFSRTPSTNSYSELSSSRDGSPEIKTDLVIVSHAVSDETPGNHTLLSKFTRLKDQSNDISKV